MNNLFKYSLFVLVFAFAKAGISQVNTTTFDDVEALRLDEDEKPQPGTIKLMAVGDIMMGTDFPNKSYLPKDGDTPFEKVQSVLSQADVLFGNHEGTLTDTGRNAKNCKDPSKCYSFRSPEKYGQWLADAGFDVMSIANNHIGDFGQIGIKNTKKTLEKHNIAHAGVFSKKTAIFTRDGVTYGFYAVAPNKDTVKIHNIKEAQAQVRKLAEQVDVVIVSFHGGAEGTKHTHVTRKTERYYGENRGNVYKFSHAMIDAGADVLLGHGPHVPRAIEVYKDRLIAYSLGNFCTFSRFNVRGIKGHAPILELNINRDGSFVAGKIHSARQIDEIYPFMDDKNGAYKTIKRLTGEDFPENGIQFNDADQTFTKL